MAIPLVLAYFMLKRKDVVFPRVFWLFAAFLFSCGTGHLIEASIFYWPVYRVSGLVKLSTALVSWATVVALVQVLPHALTLPRLAETNKRLQEEILHRDRTEQALQESREQLQQTNQELETRVQANGQMRIGAFVRDVTHQNLAERERDAALARFESVANHVPDCFWITSIGQIGIPQVEYVSPAWTMIWGYTPDEIYVVADLWLKAIVAEDLPLAEQAFYGAIASNQTSKATYRIRPKQDELRWIEDTMMPVADESGWQMWISHAREITERKQAEQTLQEQTLQEQSRQLEEEQETAHLGSWVWDVQNNHLAWSDELYRIHGLDPQHDKITFERFMEAVHPDDREETQQNCQRALETGEPFAQDQRIRHPDGRERVLLARGRAVRDERGKPVKLCGICLDVTEQRQLQQQLRRSERLSSLGTLAAGIAHEINNPMSAAWTAAETAIAVKGQPEKYDILEESLDAIVSAVKRCQMIIDNVLRLSRQEPSEKKSHDLNAIVRDAVKTMSHFVNYHAATLDVELANDLPLVFISAHGEVSSATAALRGGAVDFFVKPYSPNALLERINEAIAVDHRLRTTDSERKIVTDRVNTLTVREREIMELLSDGRSTKVIASCLGISTKTVDNHRTRVLEKMIVDNVTQLANLCKLSNGS